MKCLRPGSVELMGMKRKKIRIHCFWLHEVHFFHAVTAGGRRHLELNTLFVENESTKIITKSRIKRHYAVLNWLEDKKSVRHTDCQLTETVKILAKRRRQSMSSCFGDMRKFEWERKLFSYNVSNEVHPSSGIPDEGSGTPDEGLTPYKKLHEHKFCSDSNFLHVCKIL